MLEISGESATERKERKKFSARCGHVTRRLRKGEPLTGKVLEFALSILVGEDELSRGIAAKLKAGEKLSEYEIHLMVDV